MAYINSTLEGLNIHEISHCNENNKTLLSESHKLYVAEVIS